MAETESHEGDAVHAEDDAAQGSGNLNTPQPGSRPAGVSFPKRMAWFTVISIGIILGLHFGYEALNESIGLNPGISNVLQLVFVFLILLGWNLWFFFFSRLAWSVRLIAVCLLGLLPIVGLIFYQPVFDGDLGFVRFESRFHSVDRNYAPQLSDASAVEADSITLESTAYDFPQFLGLKRNGAVEDVELAESWDSRAPEKVWTIEVGEGWAGFSIVGDYAFTQEQRDEQELVVCYQIESGQQIWSYASERRHEDLSAVGRVGPRATPTVMEGQLFAMSATGVLDCVDAASGNLAWSVNVPELVGIDQVLRTNGRGLKYTQENSSLTWGRSASPIVYNDLVIVPAGGPDDGDAVTMIAFDRQTGDERWRGGQRTISYGSPTLIEVAGATQLCLVAEDHAVGHDPETGRELWAHSWPGHSNGDASCSQITRLDESLLLLSKGYGVGGQVIRVTQQEDEWSTETVKSNPRVLKTKMTNPVIYDGNAYSLSDGFLECAQLPELKRKWKKRGRFGNGQLLLVGNKLLVHSEAGVLYLVAAEPDKFRELGKFKTIAGVCWNTIALSKDRLLVRSELEAALIRLPLATEGDQDPAPSVSADNKVAKTAPLPPLER